MSQKSGFLIVLNGFFIKNVGHTLTKNYSGTYWPLKLLAKYYISAKMHPCMANCTILSNFCHLPLYYLSKDSLISPVQTCRWQPTLVVCEAHIRESQKFFFVIS